MSTDMTIESIKSRIRLEIANIDNKPYSDAIISVQLEAARHYFGETAKNGIIDDLGLEKFGWHKREGKIRRTDKYTDANPL